VASLKSIRRVPQIRQFTDESVPDEVVDRLLELARWTGSSKNGQPWHFIVVRERDTLKKLGALRPNINWAAAGPVGIAIVLEGKDALGEAYDEGRLTERLLTGATLLGYGAGVAWYGEPDKQAEAKRLLGIPAGEPRARSSWSAAPRPARTRDRPGRVADESRSPSS
jgi:nitroreductase